MKIQYSCDICRAPIDTVEVDALDEARFGFDCLTAEERQDMISYDGASDVMHVKSLCDACIAVLGLADEAAPASARQGLLH